MAKLCCLWLGHWHWIIDGGKFLSRLGIAKPDKYRPTRTIVRARYFKALKVELTKRNSNKEYGKHYFKTGKGRVFCVDTRKVKNYWQSSRDGGTLFLNIPFGSD